ncbi:hypothetical protein NKI10_07835 [Mesorhizobium sp. M0802]
MIRRGGRPAGLNPPSSRPARRLDDVAGGEQDFLQFRAPVFLLAQQEFQIHAEMLELLALRVLHDRLGLRVFLDRHALFVPADRLGLFDQRGDHAGKGPHLLRQFFRWLVILIETHLSLLGPGLDRPSQATLGLACNGSGWKMVPERVRHGLSRNYHLRVLDRSSVGAASSIAAASSSGRSGPFRHKEVIP